MKKVCFCFVFFLFLKVQAESDTFKMIALGTHGGSYESNLSSYLVAPINSNEFLSLDAGTGLYGIDLAIKKGSFKSIKINPKSDLKLPIEILQNHIKAYLISHAHLDHISALVINSVSANQKPIYAIDSVIDNLKNSVFNNKIWPNLGSEGESAENLYIYNRMKLAEEVSLPLDQLKVTPFLLGHPGSYESTAFLINSNNQYILYLGDTTSDQINQRNLIQTIWEKVTPLIQQGRLKALFMECSYDENRQDQELYGHLNTRYFLEELKKLALLVNPQNPKDALKNLKIFVTHIKTINQKEMNADLLIQKELRASKDLNLNLVFPVQGQAYTF